MLIIWFRRRIPVNRTVVNLTAFAFSDIFIAFNFLKSPYYVSAQKPRPFSRAKKLIGQFALKYDLFFIIMSKSREQIFF